jgi:RsiW-degrading membrane proteinase PrsW (M82 family)
METRALFLFIEILLSVLLVIWMRKSLHASSLRGLFLVKLLLYGSLVALVCAYLEMQYGDLLSDSTIHPSNKGFASLFAGSIIEEMGKYGVAVCTLLHSRYVRSTLDALIYLIIIGLGFTIMEDAIYLIQLTPETSYRLLSFYLHSGTSAIIGYSLGRYISNQTRSGELVIAILAAILLHFGYNLSTGISLSPWSDLLTLCFLVYITLQVFVLYQNARGEMMTKQTMK